MGANKRLADFAMERAKTRGISYSQALISVGEDNPALANLARQEVLSEHSVWVGEKPAETLRRYAKVYAENNGVAFSEALKAVGRSHPELVERSRQILLTE